MFGLPKPFVGEEASVSMIDPAAAASALTDIERVERKAREEMHYIGAASSYFLWGALVAVAHIISFFLPAVAMYAWNSLIPLGISGMVVLAAVNRRKAVSLTMSGGRRDLRALCLHFYLVAFGYLWFYLLGIKGLREACAYFPTLFMFGTVVLGLWYGRMFIFIGLTVTLLIVGIYLWSGPWFDPLMAVCVGGGLTSVGFWFRHMDART